jgi:ethanolamine-phosphate cytidylyltransferase
MFQEDDKKEIRIFMDGAFDLMHYGHMNAFRLGRSLGTYLMVGINSDESITECKGPPLMNDDERLAMVQSCKFVDEVIPDCPYIMNAAYVDWVIETYNIDYIVHGDDPCIVDGKDVYEAAKAAGKFRTIPRTHGISTTDIVGRILLLSNSQPSLTNTNESTTVVHGQDSVNGSTSNSLKTSNICLGQQSKFLTTSRMIHLFYDCASKVPSRCDAKQVIYVDGAWDLFHSGHVAILQAAKKVGLWIDLLHMY